jgi:NADH dehydrogenase FAD-containing subunit
VAKGGVLVLGAGVAGNAVAHYLGRGRVTVVSPTRHNVCPHADLVLGRATSVDGLHRVVTVDGDGTNHAVAYAQLVVAVGSGSRVAQLGLPVDQSGRITVDETWAVLGASHVWALGGCAALPDCQDPPGPLNRREVRRHARSLAAILRGASAA